VHGPGLLSTLRTFGHSLSRYKFFDRDLHRGMATAFYALDAVLRLADLAASPASGFCIVEWIGALPCRQTTQPVPRVDLGGLWHPCLRPDLAVDNDLNLSDRPSATAASPGPHPSSSCCPNLLVTGPNAGGKSMFIKASVLAVLFAHSLGLAPCRSHARMRPFAYVSSQINVPDVKGSRSLFEEEMHRAKQNLDALADIEKRGDESKLAFVVVDEIFSSTNPVEGISGAYSVALNLARNPHDTCIISTHYTYLCRLQSRRLNREPLFVNVQMPVDLSCVPPRYPYRVRPGVCRQYIALDLLRQNGFDTRVLEDAFEVKRRILEGKGEVGRQ